MSVILLAVLCISCGFSHVNGGRQTLTLLSIMPYPDSVPSLKPSLALGPEIEPVVELAVQQINNRSDLLSDYTLELVTADGGCNVTSKAIISLLSHVIYSGKRVAGIIGPMCSDASEAVGRHIQRPGISLISMHPSNHLGLADRTLYPNSLGIAWSALSFIDTFVALIEYNNWTSIAALYNTQMLVDYATFSRFDKELKNRTSTTITFSSHTSLRYIPLDGLKETNVRVIFAFLRESFSLQLLCIAYHKEMVFPNYQWFLAVGIREVKDVKVFYDGVNYACTLEQMINATYGAVRAFAIDETTTTSISGMTSSEFHSFHKERLPVNASSIFTFDTGRFYYDALWATALALNHSINTLSFSGFSLSNYTHGQKEVTDIIREEMYKLNFKGISGVIQFNKKTGFCERIICIEEFFNGKYQQIGCYDNKTLQINTSVAIFVPSEFKATTVYIRVSTVSVVIFMLADFVAAVLVVTAHVINTTHRNTPSIKASSVRLNHFAYTGCYFILSAVVFYTVTEASEANEASKTVLCNFLAWCIAIGSTLVFGTVCAKTWRLYRIVVSSKKLQRANNFSKDSILAAVITAMALLSVILCSVWSAVDPLTRTTKRNTITHELATVEEKCECNNIWVWLVPIFLYETFLLSSSSVLALLARNIRLKDFKTHGIVILNILLLVSSVVGMAIFLITSSVNNISVDVPYIFLCMVLCAGIYLCFFLLFLPPIRPVLIKKWLPVIKTKCAAFCQEKSIYMP